jgi:hypothetical protein
LAIRFMTSSPPPSVLRQSKALSLLALGIASAAALTPPAKAVQLQQDFAGPYAPANWTLTTNGGDGSVNTAGAPSSITLNGSDTGSLDSINTDYTISAAASGPVSFNWNYSSLDPDDIYDSFGYLLNGTFTQLANNGSQGPGSSLFNVATGDTFGFRVFTLDDTFGRGTATISNFSAPVPGPLPLLGVGAAFGYSRRLRRRISLTHGPLSTASQISDRV